MKDQEKRSTPAKPAQLMSTEGGQTKTPPGFGLSAAPLQAKADPKAPAQLKKNRNPEQEALRNEFITYRDLKLSQLTGQQKSEFEKKASQFLSWADDTTWFLSSELRWGTDKFYKRRKKDFGDYTLVLQGHLLDLRSAATKDAEAALDIARGALQRASNASELASTNLAAAEKASAEADAEATKAEAAAKSAEENAKLPDAGDAEKAAAVKAREAATAARAAADAAKAAVRRAQGSKAAATAQQAEAQRQIDASAKLITDIANNTDIGIAKEQGKTASKASTSANTLISDIDTRSAEGSKAKEDAQASATTAKAKAAEAQTEAGKTTTIKGIKEKFKAIDDAKDEKARKAKAKELAAFVREQEALYPAKIQAYKDQSTPDATEKVRVIGQIMALTARAEWLAGTIYLGGSKDTDKWETTNNNDPDKVLAGYYQQRTGSDSGEFKDDPWCTKFVGTVAKNVAGLKDKDGKEPNGSLWSGYKLGRADYFDYDTAQGGDFAGDGHEQSDTSAFKDLYKDIKAEKDEAKRKAIVDTFFKDHIKPQAGDSMIVTRESAKANSYKGGLSHSTMIERLDGYKLYTIEGNASDRVLGRVYDLTKHEDVARIIFIGRFSLNAFGKNKPKPKEGEKPQVPANETIVTEAELMAPMQKLVDLLTSYAQTKKYIDTLAEGENNTVYNLQQSTGSDKNS